MGKTYKESYNNIVLDQEDNNYFTGLYFVRAIE